MSEPGAIGRAVPPLWPPPPVAAPPSGTSRHGTARQDRLQDLKGGQAAQFFLHARQMATGDMAAFMGHDSDQLVRPSRCA